MLGSFKKKFFEWDKKKSKLLKKKRGLSFEEIVQFLTNEDNVLSITEHPNKEKYLNQQMIIVNIKGYAGVVPFEERGDKLRWLRTEKLCKECSKFLIFNI